MVRVAPVDMARLSSEAFTMHQAATLVECPRDAFQGVRTLIPAARKVAHLEALVAAGFRAIDFGSFVSPKAVPQMADSEEVFVELEKRGKTAGVEWIGIVANERGLERLLALPGVTTAGFPLSCSDTFQRRNTGASIEATWARLDTLVKETRRAGRRLKVYLSMAFGNPFGDPWSPPLVVEFAQKLIDRGVAILLLADTVGTARAETVRELCDAVGAQARGIEFGVHLHARRGDFAPKVDAALAAGCRLFDAALGGVGGCPFAGDDLTGNLPTEELAAHLKGRGFETGLEPARLATAARSAAAILAEFGAPQESAPSSEAAK
jgi:hydroxymethylglutaryl-CoA lyase